MGVSWTIETLDRVKSTQDIIKGMGAIGEPEGKAVYAKEQTQGRGRHGREWVSEKGNLYLSFLLKPVCELDMIGQLSLVVAVSLAKALQKFLKNPDALMLKWPNDVLLDGKKCAGTLLETELSEGQSLKWLAVGIGLNIVSAPDGATFLNDHRDEPARIHKVLDEILQQTADHYELWARNGFDKIKADWLAVGHTKGDPITIKIGKEMQEGKFHGIDDHGNLLLQDREFRRIKVTAGDVYI